MAKKINLTLYGLKRSSSVPTILKDIDGIFKLEAGDFAISGGLTDPWSDREIRQHAYLDAQLMYEQNIKALAKILNNYHDVDYSIRYWSILCGPWLRSFSNRLQHFWSCFETIENRNNIAIDLPNFNLDEFVANDSTAFEEIAETDFWNQLILGEIATIFGFNITLQEVSPPNIPNIPSVKRLPSKFQKIAELIFPFLDPITKNEVLIIRSNLFTYQKIKLFLRLKERPYFEGMKFNLPADFTYNHSIRHSLSKKFDKNNYRNSGFQNFLNEKIIYHLPKVYLEGFSELQDLVQDSGLPKTPKVIVTGDLWGTSEVLKIYAASKIESGTKLCLICHGGQSFLYNDYHTHEMNICDRWFSYGMRGDSEKYFSGFNIKTKKQSKITGKERSLLLILTEVQENIRFISSVPSYEQFKNGYIKDQITFIGSLSPNVLLDLNVRLAENYSSLAQKRIAKSFPEVNFIYREEVLKPWIINAKVTVITYNMTSLVEALGANKPTVVFFREENFEMNAAATPVYKALRSCNIFHDTPASAAEHINRIWDDVESWWTLPEVRDAVSLYCSQFARVSANPTKDLVTFVDF